MIYVREVAIGLSGIGTRRNWVANFCVFVALFFSIPAQASSQIEAANRLIDNMVRDVENYLLTDSVAIFPNAQTRLPNYLIHILIFPVLRDFRQAPIGGLQMSGSVLPILKACAKP